MNALASTLDAGRARAAARFRAAALPNRRLEAWKYSDFAQALGQDPIEETTAQWRLDEVPAGVELFDLALPGAPGWVQTGFGSLAHEGMAAASLGLARGGLALRVKGVVPAPLTLEFSGHGHVRALIVLEAGAELTLLEKQGGGAPALRNTGLEIILGEGAHLTHVRLEPFAKNALRLEEVAVSQARGAVYRGHYASFGARLSRLGLAIALEGAGAEAHLSGLAVLDGSHADATNHLTHEAAQTRSSQLFKYVARGKARGVYQGKVTVAPHADGADSRQTAKGLLMDDRAEIDLKPELEILADDVQCVHGAAIGDLDAESLFYLAARGIPEAEARALLIRAFLAEAVEQVPAALQERIAAAAEHALEALS